MIDDTYTAELKIDEDKFRQHQEQINLKRMEETNLPPIVIFVGEDEFVEEVDFLSEWSPEFKYQARHNEIDLREFEGDCFDIIFLKNNCIIYMYIIHCTLYNVHCTLYMGLSLQLTSH